MCVVLYLVCIAYQNTRSTSKARTFRLVLAVSKDHFKGQDVVLRLDLVCGEGSRAERPHKDRNTRMSV